jgi:hypothetical protein
MGVGADGHVSAPPPGTPLLRRWRVPVVPNNPMFTLDFGQCLPIVLYRAKRDIGTAKILRETLSRPKRPRFPGALWSVNRSSLIRKHLKGQYMHVPVYLDLVLSFLPTTTLKDTGLTAV